MEGALRELVRGAYAAAFDDTLWSDWSWRVTQALNGSCGAMYMMTSAGQLRHQAIRHKDMNTVERYVDEEIGRFDPQIMHAARLPSCVYTDLDHADRDDPATKTYFAWQRDNGKLGHYVTATARLDGGSHAAGLSIHFAAEHGPTTTPVRRAMERLLPDLHRALELGFVHAEKMTAAYWAGLLAHRHEPCLLLDARGRILRMTEGAEALLATGDGLRYVEGRLSCGGGTDSAGLDAFIGELTTACTAPRNCRIARPSGRSPFILTGYPLSSVRILSPFNAVAMVTIIDPARRADPPIESWRAAFTLTRREADVASLLVKGHSIESAAATLSISMVTARLHVRHLFAKTQTSRQSQLIGLFSRL